ncbi:DUF4238 domain-containing protein [Alicyclobacillus sp. ALC3]|uniref:DUF4238 domain-containing protein n=1 Tax=Alicyclobacillus sp. ALC3 TaxID=2796143 RepID=UPI00237856EA|nr:DUF4238 domain-containing protein [Alicyclobacillus sp. ALC3]WDL99794.1 DUF4238 domain-containing protein [Alicyclobacillus sp. ALC3]
MSDKWPIVKRQHYVPEMYLRNFADHREYIWAFNKETRSVFNTPIKNVAQERYFYDDADGPQYVEQYFSSLENDIAPILRRIISTFYLSDVHRLVNKTILTVADKTNLAWFIATQFLRTSDMRAWVTDFHEKLITAYAKTQLPSGTLRNLRIKLKKDSYQYSHAMFMFDEKLVTKLTEILFEQIWTVVTRSDDGVFYTSDTPVICFNHVDGTLQVGGLGKPGIEVIYPLNSRLVLVIRERSYLQRFSAFDNRYALIEGESADTYNEWQALMARRLVFCGMDQFEQAKEVVANAPKKKVEFDESRLNKQARDWFKSSGGKDR